MTASIVASQRTREWAARHPRFLAVCENDPERSMSIAGQEHQSAVQIVVVACSFDVQQ